MVTSVRGGPTSARTASGEHGFVDQREPEKAISSSTLASGTFAPSTRTKLSQREMVWQCWSTGTQQQPRLVARVWARDVFIRGPPALPEGSLMQMKSTRCLSVLQDICLTPGLQGTWGPTHNGYFGCRLIPRLGKSNLEGLTGDWRGSQA